MMDVESDMCRVHDGGPSAITSWNNVRRSIAISAISIMAAGSFCAAAAAAPLVSA